MLKTPEQILEEIKGHFEDTKIKWEKHLSGEEESPLLALREEGEPQVTEQIEQVLKWIDEVLKKDGIEGWKELYTKWNGDSDYTSKERYDGDKDLAWKLADLQDFLIDWEMSSQQELNKKLQNVLRTIGIDSDDENIQEKVKELNKIQTDLTELGIDKSKVKETIENERKENKLQEKWINKYLGKNVWEEIKIETRIEVKEN